MIWPVEAAPELPSADPVEAGLATSLARSSIILSSKSADERGSAPTVGTLELNVSGNSTLTFLSSALTEAAAFDDDDGSSPLTVDSAAEAEVVAPTPF